MSRKAETQSGQVGRLRRAASAIKSLFTRGRGREIEAAEPAEPATPHAAQPSRGRDKAASPTARTTRRPSDIGSDVLSRTYTPRMASGKAGFRSDGADHQHDQEFASGHADERWNDEDRFTNKSGDPRIGTHNRTYEPGETDRGSRSR